MFETQLPISDLLRIQGRYLRSGHLSRDFKDPSSLDGYIVTDQAKSSLERIASGLSPVSGHRAWRITGDYGAGKSSLALVLAHLFSQDHAHLPAHVRPIIDFDAIGVERPRLLPVLVTGSREELSSALLRSLYGALSDVCGQGENPDVIDAIRAHLASDRAVTDDTALALVQEATEYLVGVGKATGILIILDELGKFLEFAAQHPDRQDVYLLQALAETAARSGRHPLFVVGLLHQGFGAYADQLSPASQREWEKVAGRFEEVLFNLPLDQVVGLVTAALNVRLDVLPRDIVDRAARDMDVAQGLQWYGAASPREYLVDQAAQLYPFHPTVLPPLLALFNRHGQNERSLFSFLLSGEPFGLQEFAKGWVGSDRFYRLHDLYDYTHVTFGHRIALQSYRSHWNQIDSIIASFHSDEVLDVRILKTVGLLNLLDSPTLLASRDVIVLAVGDGTTEGVRRVEEALHRLHVDKHVLYYRGAAGGYCLWPYTSVNLERAYDDARRALGSVQRVSALVRSTLETRPLVARRHYITTGTLRHFDVVYISVAQRDAALEASPTEAVGRIIIPLCETEEERRDALAFAQSDKLACRRDVLVAIPRPLRDLAGLLQEMQRWQWVAENTPELTNDTYAAEEVSRQVTSSRQMLEKRVHGAIGVQQSSGPMELQWFVCGRPKPLRDRRHLLSLLSDICDEVFDQAPQLFNELVNRRSISAAAATARLRLIDRILASSSELLMGMDPSSKPPEMSMYLSVLKKTALHRQTAGGWALTEPGDGPDQDPHNVRPALQRILHVLEDCMDGRVSVAAIFRTLAEPPYGVSDGIAPILLAVFVVIHARHVALYENGSFLQSLTANDFRRLLKSPALFEIQYSKVTEVRAELFERLARILGLATTSDGRTELLDVVRPLLVFVARLPDYTHRTKLLSDRTAAVRSALLQAREPAPLVFRDLPRACGLAPFAPDETDETAVQHFVVALKGALDDLAAAYPNLTGRMKETFVRAFDASGTFEHARSAVAERAGAVAMRASETRLKAFCLRLVDDNLPEAEWLESLGSFICSKVPTKWTDIDAVQFEQELATLCGRFRRVESVAFHEGVRAQAGTAVRVAVTRADGMEVDRVLYISADEEDEVARIETRLRDLLGHHKHIGLAAMSRAFWDLSPQEGEDE